MVLNIRLNNPNMTRIGNYFYSFDEETDSVVQKTDDGTLAFSYPLDTPVANEILSLEHDGESFWTMERIDSGDPDAGFRIKRWVIENFVMVLQQTFTFDTDATDTFESNAFTVEHYTSTLTSAGNSGSSTFNVAFSTTVFALITPGTNIFLGPSTDGSDTGATERVTVASTNPATKEITISSTLDNDYASGDPIVFSKNIWVFNEHFLKTTSVGALYKVAVSDGSILSRTSGGAFLGINAANFVEITSFTGSLAAFNKPYLIFIRTTNLLFIDVNDSNLTTELSSVQNNVDPGAVDVFTVFDMGDNGNTLYRLQTSFNINGTETGPESTFNYQLATFKPFPTAIALTAVEAILPADSGTSTSTITATVTDQYLLPFSAGTIQFETTGGGTGSGFSGFSNPTGFISLESDGTKTVTYVTGDTAGLVTITAEVRIT